MAERETAELARLRDRLEAAEQALREARAKARAQVEEYKAENATLRRKLGESRSSERQARETAEEALGLAEEARARAAALESVQDKELRRLRARVEQLEAEQAAQRREERRTSRADRDEATVRARLLLDAVIEAASGLRRELALPAVAGAPADRVEAGLAEPADDARTPGVVGRARPGQRVRRSSSCWPCRAPGCWSTATTSARAPGAVVARGAAPAPAALAGAARRAHGRRDDRGLRRGEPDQPARSSPRRVG